MTITNRHLTNDKNLKRARAKKLVPVDGEPKT